MEATGYFEPLKLVISVEDLVHVECIQTFEEFFEFCRCVGEEKSGIVKLMQQLLFNVHLDQYSSTGIEIVDFWSALDMFRLQHEFVPNGVLIYNGLYFQNPSDEAQDWISLEMVKPHVRMMKEKLKFTDVQIINGLRILHDRDEEITFMSLLNTLVPTENAVLNVYVGMGKYAFSSDIRHVLRNCYDIYHGEPTQEQFEEEWNRIKEHLMERVEIEKTRADRTEIEVRRAEEEKRRAEQEKQEALNRETLLQEEKRRAEEEKRRAEEEKRRAEQEKQEALNRETLLQEEKRRAEEEKQEALNRETLLQEEKRRAEEEKRRAEKEKVKAMRDFNNAIEVRNEAIDEIIQVLNREEVLKKEKEAERVKAEAERIRADMLEKKLAKVTALFEEEKKQLLLQMQQMAGLVRA